jgi:hypothetical protein
VSALDAQVGVAEEVTFATIATPVRFPEFVSEGITATYARVESNGLRPGRLYRSDTRFTTYVEGAEGDLEMEVGSKGFGLFLKHMLGNIATTAGAVGEVNTHTATPGNLAGQSLTVQVGRPLFDGSSVQPFTYAGGKVTSWELSNSNDGNLMATLSMDFATEDVATALAAASYPTGLETFSWVGGLVTVGGTQFDVSDASVSGENSLKTDRRYLRNNPAKKEQIGDDYRGGEFSLEADFDSLAQRNRVASATAAGAMAEVVLSWVGKSLAGTSTFPELVVTLQGRFDQFEANVGGPAAVTQSLTGTHLGSNAISIDYKTMDATP